MAGSFQRDLFFLGGRFRESKFVSRFWWVFFRVFSRDFLGCFWIRGALLARRWTRSILAFLTTSVVGMVAGSYCKWTIVTPSNTNMEPKKNTDLEFFLVPRADFQVPSFFCFQWRVNSGNLLRHLGRVIDRITRASILVDHHLSSQVSFQGENNYLCSKRDYNKPRISHLLGFSKNQPVYWNITCGFCCHCSLVDRTDLRECWNSPDFTGLLLRMLEWSNSKVIRP